MDNKVTLGLVQISCTNHIEENIERTIARVIEAATRGAQIICLQELFDLPYLAQRVDIHGYELARSVEENPVLHRLGTLAGELGIVLIVPFYEKADRGLYFNTAAVFDVDGRLLGTTRKSHIPDGPQYHEKYYFTPGNSNYPVYSTRFGRIGVGICWDEWFPEVARILSLKGAEILFYPSAIGSEPDHPELSTKPIWEKAISAHGIYNGTFVAVVNRTGKEDEMTFYGGSFISNPFGEIISQLNGEEGVLVQEIDRNDISSARHLLQFLRDRRPETYAPLLHQELR